MRLGKYSASFMAAGRYIVLLTGMYFLCGNLWAAPDFLPESPAAIKPPQHGFVFLGLIASSAGAGLDYVRRNQGGQLRARAHDEFNYSPGQFLPWLSASYQTDSAVSLGAEYLTVSGQSDGEIDFRQALGGIFSWLVSRPETTTYDNKVGRTWVGYDALKRDDLVVTPYAGLYITHLHMKAVSPDLGEIEDTLLGAMPLVGLRVMAGNPQDGRILLVLDYAYINVNQINAYASHVTIAGEREFAPHWIWGVGYTSRNVRISADKDKYDAAVSLGVRGFFSHVKREF